MSYRGWQEPEYKAWREEMQFKITVTKEITIPDTLSKEEFEEVRVKLEAKNEQLTQELLDYVSSITKQSNNDDAYERAMGVL